MGGGVGVGMPCPAQCPSVHLRDEAGRQVTPWVGCWEMLHAVVQQKEAPGECELPLLLLLLLLLTGAGGEEVAGGGGTRTPPLSPSPSLLSASGRGDRWPLGAGCSIPPGRAPRMRAGARLIAAAWAPSPRRPRPSSRRVARQPRLGALPLAGGAPGSRAARGQLVSAAAAWPGAWLRARVDAASRLTFPGARRGLRAGRGPGRMEQPGPPRKKSLLTRFLSRGRTASRGGGGGVAGAGGEAAARTPARLSPRPPARPGPWLPRCRAISPGRLTPARAGKSQTGPGARPESPGPKGWRWTCTREVRPGGFGFPPPAARPHPPRKPARVSIDPVLRSPTLSARSPVRRDSGLK